MKATAQIFSIFLAFFLFTSCNATEKEVSTLIDGELNWITIEDAQTLNNKGEKYFLVDVYTDWCVWCKVMDKKTFTNEEVKSFLNDHFYVVKFNAEQKEPLDFRGKTYEWKSAGKRGVNMFAVELLNGRLSYPSLVIMDENLQKLRVVPGYKTPEQLMELLKGFIPAGNS